MNSTNHKVTKRQRHAAKLLVGIAVLAAIPPSGCRRAEDLSPPEVAYGQTECDRCRMIISEAPFAAAAVVAEPDGVRKLAFDDIGCLLDFLRDGTPGARVISYVHDHLSHRWLDASKAVFVRSETLQTPMASHLAASESPSGADDLLRRYPGERVDFAELRTGAVPILASDSSVKERSNP